MVDIGDLRGSLSLDAQAYQASLAAAAQATQTFQGQLGQTQSDTSAAAASMSTLGSTTQSGAGMTLGLASALGQAAAQARLLQESLAATEAALQSQGNATVTLTADEQAAIAATNARRASEEQTNAAIASGAQAQAQLAAAQSQASTAARQAAGDDSVLAASVRTVQASEDEFGRSIQTTISYLDDGNARVQVAISGYDDLGQKGTATAAATGEMSAAMRAASEAAETYATDLGAAASASGAMAASVRTAQQSEDEFGRSVQTTISYLDDGNARVQVAISGYNELGQRGSAVATAEGEIGQALQAASLAANTNAAGLSGAAEAEVTAAESGGGLLEMLGGLNLAGLAAAAGITVGAGAIVSFAKDALGAAEDMQNAGAQIAATGNVSSSAGAEMADSFRNTGEAGQFSGTQIAQAYAPLAGILQGVGAGARDAAGAHAVMTAAESLAIASGEKLSTTTQAVATDLRAYHLSAADATTVSDELWNAMQVTGQSADTLSQRAAQLQERMGPFNLSFTEAIGLLEGAAQSGDTTGRMVMSLSTGFDRLLSSSKATTQALQENHIAILDTNGGYLSATTIMGEVERAEATMTDAQKGALDQALFGQAGFARLWDTISAGQTPLTIAAKNHDALGTAAGAAAKNEDTFGAAMHRIGSAVADDILQPIGNLAITAIYGFMEHLIATEKVVGDFIEELEKLPGASAVLGHIGEDIVNTANQEAQGLGKMQAALDGASSSVQQLATSTMQLGPPVSLMTKYEADFGAQGTATAADIKRAGTIEGDAQVARMKGMTDVAATMEQEAAALRAGNTEQADSLANLVRVETEQHTLGAQAATKEASETKSAQTEIADAQIAEGKGWTDVANLHMAAAQAIQQGNSELQHSYDEQARVAEAAHQTTSKAATQAAADATKAAADTRAANADIAKGYMDAAAARQQAAQLELAGDAQQAESTRQLAQTLEQADTQQHQADQDAQKAHHDGVMAQIADNAALAQSYFSLETAIRSGNEGAIQSERDQLTALQQSQQEQQAETAKTQTLQHDYDAAMHQYRMDEIAGDTGLANAELALAQAIQSGSAENVRAVQEELTALQNSRQEEAAQTQKSQQLLRDETAARHQARMDEIAGDHDLAAAETALAQAIESGSATSVAAAQAQLTALQYTRQETAAAQQAATRLTTELDTNAKASQSAADAVTALGAGYDQLVEHVGRSEGAITQDVLTADQRQLDDAQATLARQRDLLDALYAREQDLLTQLSAAEQAHNQADVDALNRRLALLDDEIARAKTDYQTDEGNFKDSRTQMSADEKAWLDGIQAQDKQWTIDFKANLSEQLQMMKDNVAEQRMIAQAQKDFDLSGLVATNDRKIDIQAQDIQRTRDLAAIDLQTTITTENAKIKAYQDTGKQAEAAELAKEEAIQESLAAAVDSIRAWEQNAIEAQKAVLASAEAAAQEQAAAYIHAMQDELVQEQVQAAAEAKLNHDLQTIIQNDIANTNQIKAEGATKAQAAEEQADTARRNLAFETDAAIQQSAILTAETRIEADDRAASTAKANLDDLKQQVSDAMQAISDVSSSADNAIKLATAQADGGIKVLQGDLQATRSAADGVGGALGALGHAGGGPGGGAGDALKSFDPYGMQSAQNAQIAAEVAREQAQAQAQAAAAQAALKNSQDSLAAAQQQAQQQRQQQAAAQAEADKANQDSVKAFLAFQLQELANWKELQAAQQQAIGQGITLQADLNTQMQEGVQLQQDSLTNTQTVNAGIVQDNISANEKTRQAAESSLSKLQADQQKYSEYLKAIQNAQYGDSKANIDAQYNNIVGQVANDKQQYQQDYNNWKAAHDQMLADLKAFQTLTIDNAVAATASAINTSVSGAHQLFAQLSDVYGTIKGLENSQVQTGEDLVSIYREFETQMQAIVSEYKQMNDDAVQQLQISQQFAELQANNVNLGDTQVANEKQLAETERQRAISMRGDLQGMESKLTDLYSQLASAQSKAQQDMIGAQISALQKMYDSEKSLFNDLYTNWKNLETQINAAQTATTASIGTGTIGGGGDTGPPITGLTGGGAALANLPALVGLGGGAGATPAAGGPLRTSTTVVNIDGAMIARLVNTSNREDQYHELNIPA